MCAILNTVCRRILTSVSELHRQRDDLDAGLRREPNLFDLEDEAKVIGRQMEQVIADILLQTIPTITLVNAHIAG